MYIQTEAIVLRQIKTLDGRRMMHLFTRRFGKISCGTNMSEKGKNKSNLALRPFTYCNYDLYKKRDYFNINGAEVKKSFFRIGEDIEKYMTASFVLEFTDKLLVEGQENHKLFDLLLEFLELLEDRKEKFETLSIGYQLKAIELMGIGPNLKKCVLCDADDNITGFSVKDGGLLCHKCMKNIQSNVNAGLIFEVNFDIVNILRYFINNPLSSLKKIGLTESAKKEIMKILDAYSEYYLDLGDLKSKGFKIEGGIK